MDFPSLCILHKIFVEEENETSLGTLKNLVMFPKTLNQNLCDSNKHVVTDDIVHGCLTRKRQDKKKESKAHTWQFKNRTEEPLENQPTLN